MGVELLIPLIAPLITREVRKLVQGIPKVVVVCAQPILGAILAGLADVSGIAEVTPLAGAELGLVGVGIREVIHQGNKAAKEKQLPPWLYGILAGLRGKK